MHERPINLLFVCTANVCRSPLAAGMMAHNAKQLGVRANIASASLDEEIRATHETTINLLAERGITLARDYSQPLDDFLANGADLVLVMTSEHARNVVGRFPKIRRKVFLLKHLTMELEAANDGESLDAWLAEIYKRPRNYSREERWDIEDPNHQSDEMYKRVAVQIDNATTWLATVLSTL